MKSVIYDLLNLRVFAGTPLSKEVEMEMRFHSRCWRHTAGRIAVKNRKFNSSKYEMFVYLFNK